MGGFQSVKLHRVSFWKVPDDIENFLQVFTCYRVSPTMSLAVCRDGLEVKVGHKTKRWISTVPKSWEDGWLCFYWGKVLFGHREEKALVCT